MRLHSFNICTNTNGYITGLQFGLSETYNSIDQFLGPEVVLGAIGDVSSDCKSYVLDGSITRIRAYKGALPGVRSMAFYKGNTVKIFGQEKDEYTEWLFDDSHPLVGLYGNHRINGIEKLGFITLDTFCQAIPPTQE